MSFKAGPPCSRRFLLYSSICRLLFSGLDFTNLGLGPSGSTWDCVIVDDSVVLGVDISFCNDAASDTVVGGVAVVVGEASNKSPCIDATSDTVVGGVAVVVDAASNKSPCIDATSDTEGLNCFGCGRAPVCSIAETRETSGTSGAS